MKTQTLIENKRETKQTEYISGSEAVLNHPPEDGLGIIDSRSIQDDLRKEVQDLTKRIEEVEAANGLRSCTFLPYDSMINLQN